MKDHLMGWAGLMALVVAEHPHPVRRPAAMPRVPEDPAVRAKLRAEDRAMAAGPGTGDALIGVKPDWQHPVSTTDADGWIPHKPGAPCPVEEGTIIDWKTPSLGIGKGWVCNHRQANWDLITAYRLSKA